MGGTDIRHIGRRLGCRLRQGAGRLIRDQRGNALMLTAAAIVPVIGIVGSAVDIGRAYMTQLRLQQACDAGVLAGRRAMAAGVYGDDHKAEANKMFAFNFPNGIYGSEAVNFSSQSTSAADVVGTASVKLPTAIMYIFGKDKFDLGVNCTAKLEISNVDVMLVLDVTGSMARKASSSDDDTKIEALRKAAVDFFDTLTNADIGDGRLRFGVVPYSSSVNVGQILVAKNPDWIADTVWLPSREPVTKEVWGDARTVVSEDYTATNPVANTNWQGAEKWEDAGKADKAQADCTTWDDSDLPRMVSESLNPSNPVVDGSTRITVSDSKRTYEYYSYKGTWKAATWSKPASCEAKKLRWTFTRTYQVTKTETLTKVFDGKYNYKDRGFDTRPLKTGSTIEEDTGYQGERVTIDWAGCIIERATTQFASNASAPSNAYDMDIDMVPSATDSDTQWKTFLPALTYDRERVSERKGVTTNYQNFVDKGGDYAACPVAAMNLTTMTKADHDDFDKYIKTLQPKGYTYHDAGMAWGARLISPTGLFAADNGPYNGRPVSRHIVFMTDGDMMTPRANLSHQGQERSMPRIGATSDNDAIDRHNNRFRQLCESAKRKGLTIWVISFGVGSNSNLNSCASTGQAFEADNAAQLNAQFQAIARQISKLRLSQ
ncbi:TadE/TadG family type IV pilus assembly protein [Sphingopyxis granuli]|uniref:Flp pilus assembly protein TadG n=1 Tax=Sphingopyxis granuli TaxID=267128 RepID=A0AA86GJ05_9SPHN|nr:TadE/TadG family type IV pilus assembly protein [Sphingopyxis granuli]AMG73160.1 Flp pilus assembly protein TadG [Sphingopyxis granuli]